MLCIKKKDLLPVYYETDKIYLNLHHDKNTARKTGNLKEISSSSSSKEGGSSGALVFVCVFFLFLFPTSLSQVTCVLYCIL